MSTIEMEPTSRPADARCQQIRSRLRAFSDGTLGPTATGEVRGHLLSCDGCNEAYSDLLFEDIESGVVPLLEPPFVPPVEWYDAFMRAGSSRFGVFWRSVRDALDTADQNVRTWRQNQIDTFVTGLQLLNAAPKLRVLGAVRTRGAVHTRHPDKKQLMADVVLPSGESRERAVRFDVVEAARVTADQRFTLNLATDSTDYDNALAVCTVSLGSNRVSFAGTIARREGQPQREVRIDEAGVPGPPCTIPEDRLALAVLAS